MNTRSSVPDASFQSRIALVGGAVALALVLITFAIPLGSSDRVGAGPLGLASWAAILLLAAAAGYAASMPGAVGFAAVVGLAGPYLARALGPAPDEGSISLFSVPVILVPILLLPGLVGMMVRLWR